MDIFEILYAVLFVTGALGAGVFVIVERRKGKTWLEAFRPVALLFGISGFAAGQAFFDGAVGFVVSLSCMVPTLPISLHHSRRLLREGTEAKLPAGDVRSTDPGQRALAETDLADFVRDNARLRRRMMRMTVIPAIPLAAIGALYGSWFAAVLGGLMGLGFGLVASFVTRPLAEANRLVSKPDAGAGPLPPAVGDDPADRETL